MTQEPEPIPTFDSKRDKALYLIAEYKYIIASMVIAASVITAWGGTDIEIPGWTAGLSAAYLLLGPPSYIAGIKIIQWVRSRKWVDVYHVNAADEVIKKWLVPPETWSGKTVDGPPPRPVNDGDAFEVRAFDWMGDVEQLHVEGSRFEETMDSKMLTSRSYAEEVHDFLEESHATLKNVRDQWSRMSIDIKGAVVNQISEAHERGINPANDAAKDIWEEAESDLDEQIDAEIPGITHDHVEQDMQQYQANNSPDTTDSGTSTGNGEGGVQQ